MKKIPRATPLMQQRARHCFLHKASRFAIYLSALALPIAAGAQQSSPPANAPAKPDIAFYDVVAGYAFLHSTNIDLNENGFQFQAGVTPKHWLTLGFDYSVSSGSSAINPTQVPPALAQELAAVLQQLAAAGRLPPGYKLSIPFDALTQTFAAGPQFDVYRRRQITLFVRPSLGAVREQVTARPKDPIQTLIVQQLVPTGKKTDWQGFYGFGGGMDYDLTSHFGIRLQADEVYDHLFNDLLKDGRWTTRIGAGLSFRFGKSPFGAK